jgi:hypothetical protein
MGVYLSLCDNYFEPQWVFTFDQQILFQCRARRPVAQSGKRFQSSKGSFPLEALAEWYSIDTGQKLCEKCYRWQSFFSPSRWIHCDGGINEFCVPKILLRQ